VLPEFRQGKAYLLIAYLQAAIDGSRSTFRNLKDKQGHILKFSTTTNAESKPSRASAQFNGMVLLLLHSNGLLFLPATYKSNEQLMYFGRTL
jgi:hypothetical protein